MVGEEVGFEAAKGATGTPPADTFADADLARRSWPLRVPAWWNPSMQPLGRPAFRRISGGEDAREDARWRE